MKIGDLVKHNSAIKNDKNLLGIIVKKMYKTETYKGEKHTELVYGVMLPDGEILDFKYKNLEHVQGLTK